MFAYVGSYTTPERKGHGNGINVYRVDPRSGAFRHIQTLGGLENPSFLAINKAGTHLYSVHGDRSEATAYTIHARTGHLSVLNRQSTGGYPKIATVISADLPALGRASPGQTLRFEAVTVEAALLGAPMVTYYRVTSLSWAIGKVLVDVPFYSMVNLIAGRRIVEELMQDAMKGENLAAETRKPSFSRL